MRETSESMFKFNSVPNLWYLWWGPQRSAQSWRI